MREYKTADEIREDAKHGNINFYKKLSHTKKGDNKMKYLVVDNQMEYGATEEIKEFEILEDAMEYAEYSWNRMSDSDKKHTTAYYVLESANPDEESDDHYDGDIIKRWK